MFLYDAIHFSNERSVGDEALQEACNLFGPLTVATIDQSKRPRHRHDCEVFRRPVVTLQPRVAHIIAVALRKKRRKGLKVVS